MLQARERTERGYMVHK